MKKISKTEANFKGLDVSPFDANGGGIMIDKKKAQVEYKKAL